MMMVHRTQENYGNDDGPYHDGPYPQNTRELNYMMMVHTLKRIKLYDDGPYPQNTK